MEQVNWLKDSLKIITISSIVFFACTRGSDEVNKTVRPDSQQFTTTVSDTFTVKTATILFDSSISNNSNMQLIGSYSSSDFGKVTSNVYLQFLPHDYKKTLGPNPKFDSLNLALIISTTLNSLSGFTYNYGIKSNIQKFYVKRLNEDISESNLKYNNAKYSVSEKIAEFIIDYNNLDSIVVENVKLKYIKIPLPDLFGLEFVSESQRGALSNKANFLNFFKGLFIENDPNNSCVTRIIAAAIVLDYHNFYSINNLKVNEEFGMVLNSNLRTQVRNLTVDRSGTPLAALKNNYDEISLSDCYVQASTGVCTKISFPFLLDFKKRLGIDKLVINRAELIITPDLTNTGAYPVPSSLYFYEFDEKGKSIRSTNGLPSKKITSSEGEFNPSSIYYFIYNSNTNNYIIKQQNSDDEVTRQVTETLNITRFVQSIMDGKTSPNESLVLASDERAFFPVTIDNNRNRTYQSIENYAEVNQLKFKSSREGIKLRLFYTPHP